MNKYDCRRSQNELLTMLSPPKVFYQNIAQLQTEGFQDLYRQSSWSFNPVILQGILGAKSIFSDYSAFLNRILLFSTLCELLQDEIRLYCVKFVDLNR